MRIYKLTSQFNTTNGGFEWTPKKWKKVSGIGELCTSGWLHAYQDPFVAVLMNTVHACIDNPKLWEAEGRGEFKDDNGLKCGYSQMRIIKEIPLPKISSEDRIKIAIYCAILSGEDSEDFISWALNWLDGSDRSKKSAYRVEWLGRWPAHLAVGVTLELTRKNYEAVEFLVARAIDSASKSGQRIPGFNLKDIIYEIVPKAKRK
jgi:hypothetical protein